MLNFKDWLNEQCQDTDKQVSEDMNLKQVLNSKFEDLVNALNAYAKDSKYSKSDIIVKKGSFYDINDLDSMDQFGLAIYDEDGRYMTVYDKKTVQDYIKNFISNLDKESLNDFVSNLK